VRRYFDGDFGRGGTACPVALKRFVAFSKNGHVKAKYLSSLQH